jgi:hypothetical protein
MTHRIHKGSRVVIGIVTDAGISSRLYVNNGETATLVCAKHKTLAGMQRWAAKVLA